MTEQHPRRPLMPGDATFDRFTGEVDPADRAEAAHRTAALLAHGVRGSGDAEVVRRIVEHTDEHGFETLAELWSHSPAVSLPGAMWRLYLLRGWVHADPESAAREFDAGRRFAPVSEVVAGVVDPPGAAEVRELSDKVLMGAAEGDLATTFDRAAAFCRIVSAGRAELGSTPADQAARLLTMAEQLEAAARAERAGELS